MGSAVNRDKNLPDFKNPPLNEVILGVQFQPPRGYNTIFAHEVWDLFRSSFPSVQSVPALPPSFETFGIPQASGGMTIDLQNFPMMAINNNRYWFLNKESDHLIQFQNDRFYHNWRKVEGKNNEYPRYENIFAEFSNELKLLSDYYRRKFGHDVSINQCEITYTNHMYYEDEKLSPNFWFNLPSVLESGVEDFAFNFRNPIFREDGSPYGRIIFESSSAVHASGARLIAANITVRGAPASPSLEDALDFFGVGREMIVNLFAEVTTDRAHQVWERVG